MIGVFDEHDVVDPATKRVVPIVVAQEQRRFDDDATASPSSPAATTALTSRRRRWPRFWRGWKSVWRSKTLRSRCPSSSMRRL